MIGWLFFLTGSYPLWRAWLANRRTTLLQAVNWSVVAWAAWAWALCPGAGDTPTGSTLVYVALCLTGCAGVAVLGARRPGVGAWNFVVVVLLAVMLLPLAESLIAAGPLPLAGPRTVFLAGTLAVSILLNYLPTRLAPAAGLLALACAIEVILVVDPALLGSRKALAAALSPWLLALTPWVALGCWHRRPAPAAAFDFEWLDFRDRFGLFWGQRVREQFNRSAAHAGWAVQLRWSGLRLQPGASVPGPAVQAAMVATLRALMKRFGTEEEALERGKT
jgi:hypothetical protein